MDLIIGDKDLDNTILIKFIQIPKGQEEGGLILCELGACHVWHRFRLVIIEKEKNH